MPVHVRLQPIIPLQMSPPATMWPMLEQHVAPESTLRQPLHKKLRENLASKTIASWLEGIILALWPRLATQYLNKEENSYHLSRLKERQNRRLVCQDSKKLFNRNCHLTNKLTISAPKATLRDTTTNPARKGGREARTTCKQRWRWCRKLQWRVQGLPSCNKIYMTFIMWIHSRLTIMPLGRSH